MKKKNSLDFNDEGFNCAESVVLAFADRLGIDSEDAAKIACGFGAGMGRTGGVCGAVSGAVMVLGMKFGRTFGEDKEAKERVYSKVKDFSEEFRKRTGHTSCKGLLGHDVSTEEGQAFVEDNPELRMVCRNAIQLVSDILESLLVDEQT